MKLAAPYTASTVKDQIPKLPEAWSVYLLYQEHSNVEICTVCDDDVIKKLTVGQHVVLTVGRVDDNGFWSVIISADGSIIGYLPASALRKEILRKRDMQWHEAAYIDGIDANGQISLSIGLYSLYYFPKTETERYRFNNSITAS